MMANQPHLSEKTSTSTVDGRNPGPAPPDIYIYIKHPVNDGRFMISNGECRISEPSTSMNL